MVFFVSCRFFAHLILLRTFFSRIGILSAFATVIVIAPIIGMRSLVGLHIFAIFTAVAVDVLIDGTGSRKQKQPKNKNYAAHSYGVDFFSSYITIPSCKSICPGNATLDGSTSRLPRGKTIRLRCFSFGSSGTFSVLPHI